MWPVPVYQAMPEQGDLERPVCPILHAGQYEDPAAMVLHLYEILSLPHTPAHFLSTQELPTCSF